MRISYDQSDDAIYIRFSEAEYFESDEVREGIVLDFDKAGQIVAMEILDVSKRLPATSMDNINFEMARPDRSGK